MNERTIRLLHAHIALGIESAPHKPQKPGVYTSWAFEMEIDGVPYRFEISAGENAALGRTAAETDKIPD